jgi:hypothetical protein
MMKTLLYPILLILAIIGLIFWAIYASIICSLTIPIFLIVSPIFGTKTRIKCVNYLIGMFWEHLTWFIEYYSGNKFVFYGDNVPLRESAIVITNHTSFIDWLMCFPFALRKGRLGCLNFFAKDIIKYIPGFGWYFKNLKKGNLVERFGHVKERLVKGRRKYKEYIQITM